MKYIIFTLLLLVQLSAHAQTATISGTVQNSHSQPLNTVNILLLRASDSAFTKAAVSNESGHYEFEGMPDGEYLVKASMVGYEPVYTASFSVSAAAMTIPLILLKEQSKDLKEVTVVAPKQLIEVQAGKLVVNVANSITSTGTTAFEVLQRAPGVSIDQNDNISLKGKQGVLIMIDDKLVPIQGADLANQLKSMPSGSIEKIELISNPGARYDAAGAAGIINIKTKKDRKMGVNGTLSAGYGQGIYPKANTGGSLNYRNKKWNFYTNYNYYYRKGTNELTLDRRFYENGTFQSAYEQLDNPTLIFKTHTATVGVDYTLDSKTTLGAAFNGGYTSFDDYGLNHSNVLDSTEALSSRFTTSTNQKNHWDNYGLSLNTRHSFDTSGTALNVDADYARYGNGNNQHLATNYFLPDGTIYQQPYLLYGTMTGSTEIFAVKADFVRNLKHGIKLETGVKTSFVTADNSPLFYDQSNGGNQYDSTRSNHFIYHENINAGYVNLSGDWKKWSLMFGLRGEQTRATGDERITDQQFNRNYFQLFPNLALTYHLATDNDLSLSLSRRIDRPNYQQLNPFKRYLDLTTYNTGNPYLNPALTYATELSYTYKSRFVTTLAYSRTTDVITQVIVPDPVEKVTIVTDKNLALNTSYTLSGAYPFQVFKWWNSTTSFSLYYTHYEGDLANTPLSDGTPVFGANTANYFTVSPTWTAEVSGWYQSKQRYGYMKLDPMYSIDFGVQKSLMKKKITVKMNVTDLLWKANPAGLNEFTGYQEHFIVKRDSRTINLAITYRFGNRAAAPARHRESGAEEEKRRAGSGS